MNIPKKPLTIIAVIAVGFFAYKLAKDKQWL